MATVWRVDLDTDSNDWRTRKQIRCTSLADAQDMYRAFLACPPQEYTTVSLVADCRVRYKQMLHGDQEHIS